ncbi:MAG TPA: SPOR domain-containing protein [Alphaproteobacteria bacterium]|nr:SPOR domain-containing protein [Alphaproteobacteria bacterium]
MTSELGTLGPRDPLRAIYEREESRPRRRRYVGMAAGAVVLIAFACVTYYAYHEGVRRGSESVAPLIRADQTPYKVKPENPGGMDIPNQDKLIYREVTPNGIANKPEAEKLLPPPEQPMARPTPEVASAAPAASSASEPVKPIVPAPSGATVARPAGVPGYVPMAPVPAPTADKPVSAAPATPPASAASAQTTAPKVASATSSAKAAPVSLANAWRVQLGAFRSNGDAQNNWARLRKAHPDLLGALTLAVERIDLGPNRGVFYRMQAGPLPDKDVAGALCDRLKAAHVGCIAVKP